MLGYVVDNNKDGIPENVYHTDGSISGINIVNGCQATETETNIFVINCGAGKRNFLEYSYVIINNPIMSQNIVITQVIRSDGSLVPPENYWKNNSTIHIIDYSTDLKLVFEGKFQLEIST